MKRLTLCIVACALGSINAFAEGETPAVIGSGTQTPVQVVSDTRTPEQPALGDTTTIRLALAGQTSAKTDEKPSAGQQEAKPAVLTHEQICGAIYTNYSQALLSDPELNNTKNAAYNGTVGLAYTMARHTTLQRLITIAMAQNCDAVPFISLESRVIRQTYTTPQVR